METVPPGIAIRSSEEGLSAGDIHGVATLYGLPPWATTITTNPPGLDIVVNGRRVATPATRYWRHGIIKSLRAPSPQVNGESRYVFARWNTDRAREHNLTVGEHGTWLEGELHCAAHGLRLDFPGIRRQRDSHSALRGRILYPADPRAGPRASQAGLRPQFLEVDALALPRGLPRTPPPSCSATPSTSRPASPPSPSSGSAPPRVRSSSTSTASPWSARLRCIGASTATSSRCPCRPSRSGRHRGTVRAATSSRVGRTAARAPGASTSAGAANWWRYWEPTTIWIPASASTSDRGEAVGSAPPDGGPRGVGGPAGSGRTRRCGVRNLRPAFRGQAPQPECADVRRARRGRCGPARGHPHEPAVRTRLVSLRPEDALAHCRAPRGRAAGERERHDRRPNAFGRHRAGHLCPGIPDPLDGRRRTIGRGADRAGRLRSGPAIRPLGPLRITRRHRTPARPLRARLRLGHGGPPPTERRDLRRPGLLPARSRERTATVR